MSEKAETQSGTSALEAVKWLVVALLVGVAVWGNSYYGDVSPLYRALAVGALGLAAAFVALQTIQGRAFNQLRKDAMVEVRKVVWPTRQETVQTTLIVLAFVLLVSLILFFFDWVLNGIVSRVIG
ncbi:preprotein translocase subunit SecE [Alcanivorax quisquiliarum]|uniref:Protein translocase subunit SecE n=1 Tax=Alcanivorax quisquiliarum TaxID=2933565 RepID=A0ABT0EAK4_9GAMM|nr:preprotein translocase subunit SecE [Alcanivorax quisquiliarum]MCK0538871.1 preprotein translocase subunit SecE [Alcanivorax quisquiliarum]